MSNGIRQHGGWRLLWVAVFTLWFSCGEATEQATSEKPVLERVSEALLSDGGECEQSEDCASGVCQMGLCRSLLDSDQAWMEKAVAIRVRGYIRQDPAVGDELFGSQISALNDGDPYGQGRFIAFAGHLGDSRALPVLKEWSNSPIERISVLCHLARTRLRDRSSYATTRGLLQHRSVAVQLDAMDALSLVLHDAGAVDDVLVFLQSDDHRLRQRAVNTLGALEPVPSRVSAALESMLENESDGFLRGDILRALGR